MHVTYPISIIENNGIVHHVDEEEAERIARDIYFGDIALSESHCDTYVDYLGNVRKTYNRYIARDDHGQIITNKNWPFKPDFHGRNSRWAKAYRDAERHGLPIPGTGCYKKGSWTQFKSGIAENRIQESHAQQMSDLIVAGKFKNLKRKRPAPDWDAPRRGEQRCWKKQRRTQWK